MKNTIILIFAMCSLLFGQYTNNLLPNEDFNTNLDGWNAYPTTTITWTASLGGRSGVMKITGNADGVTILTTTNLASECVLGDTIIFSAYSYIPSGQNFNTDRAYFGTGNDLIANLVGTDSWVKIIGYQKIKSTTSITFYFRANNTVMNTGEICYVDSAVVLLKLDTLYIDKTSGNNSNTGQYGFPVQTITEAMQTRNAHAGGIFVSTQGNYDESVTINNEDASFKLWYSVGGATTVTTVDFNNVTATLFDVYVTNASNDGNITYTYTPSATTDTERKFRNYKNWSGFKP